MTDQSGKTIHLSIVIPAFNEEKRLGPSLEEIGRYLAGKPFEVEIIVVDDGSTDQTSAVAREGLAGRLAYQIIRLEANRGKGYAVRTGILASSGDIVLFTDADLATPIGELDKFLPRLDEGCDVVIGSRAIPGSDIRVRQARPRQAMGKFFNRLVRLFILEDFRDTQCGFKAFRRPAALNLFSRLETSGFAFDVEILVLAGKLGCKIAEVPVVWRHSPPSRVRIVRSSWQMLKELWRIRRLR